MDLTNPYGTRLHTINIRVFRESRWVIYGFLGKIYGFLGKIYGFLGNFRIIHEKTYQQPVYNTRENLSTTRV